MKKKTQVLVIGGGAVGICTAYYLWKSGQDVTVIEKGEIGSGCSDKNSGLIVPSHFIPLAAPGVIAKGFRQLGRDPRAYRRKLLIYLENVLTVNRACPTIQP